MARNNVKQTKEKANPENVLLLSAIIGASIAVLVFVVWLLVTIFMNDDEDDTYIYENYYSLNTTEFETILKINNGSLDSNNNPYTYDLLLNNDSTNTDPDRNRLYYLLADSDIIYILVFSSTDNYTRRNNPNDDDSELIGDKIEEIVIDHISFNNFEVFKTNPNYPDEPASDYVACFLIYDYKNLDFSNLSSYYQQLKPTEQNNPTNKIDWNVDYASQYGILNPWLIEIKSPEASFIDKYEIYVYSGDKGSVKDWFYIELVPALEALKQDN